MLKNQLSRLTTAGEEAFGSTLPRFNLSNTRANSLTGLFFIIYLTTWQKEHVLSNNVSSEQRLWLIALYVVSVLISLTKRTLICVAV